MNNALFPLQTRPYDQISLVLIVSAAMVETGQNEILSNEQRGVREKLLKKIGREALTRLAHYIQRQASTKETIQILEHFHELAPTIAAGFQQGYLQPSKP